MTGTVHLTITTPATVLVEGDDIVAVRAEDESGSFGILPGHADLLTMLTSSVVRWRTSAGVTRYCAVQGGVFTVSKGEHVAIACREAVVGDDLKTLEAQVHALRAKQLEADRSARLERVRLHAAAVRELVRYLRPTGQANADTELVTGDGGAAP